MVRESTALAARRNFLAGTVGYGVVVLLMFVTRTVLVQSTDQTIVGLNAIALNLISIIAVAEGGISAGIAFRLYRPLAASHVRDVDSWLLVARHLYRWAILGMLCVGLLATLSLWRIHEHLGFPAVYVIAVGAISTAQAVFSCSFGSSKILLLADQQGHRVITAQCLAFALQTLAQIGAIVYLDSFLAFLFCAALGTLLWNWLCHVEKIRLYGRLETRPIDRVRTRSGWSDLRNLIPYRLGAVGLNATDAIIIAVIFSSSLAGVVSNFTLIVNSINGVLMQGFNSLAASIGLHNVEGSPKQRASVFYELSSLSIWLFGGSAICLATLLNPFMEVWIGVDFQIDGSVIVALVGAFFVTGTNQVPALYRSSLGLFRETTWVPILAMSINLGLSILLAFQFGLLGVFVATILARTFTFSLVDPYLVVGKTLGSDLKLYFGHFLFGLTGVILITWGMASVREALYVPSFTNFGGLAAGTACFAFAGLASWLLMTTSFRSALRRLIRLAR